MAPPVPGDDNLPLRYSDIHLINNRHTPIYDSVKGDFTISQLAKSKTPLPNPPSPSSFTSVLGKRRKSKPVKYSVHTTVAEKINPPLKPNIVVIDPSSNCLSSPKGNSATKCFKSPVESSPPMDPVEKIRSSIGTKHPSFIKPIGKAHVDVGGGYWMGFSQPFSKFLPKVDTDMIIEDENGDTHHVKYNANKYGLGAGWKKFASDHDLLERDVLIFQLVKPFKFKVYIVRANDVNKADVAVGPLNMEAHTIQTVLETGTPSTTSKKRKCQNSIPFEALEKKQILPTPTSSSGNDSEEVGSEVLEGSTPSKPNLPFPSQFQDFHIMVQGQCIDCELPEYVRMKYHNLCISRKVLLHDCLPEDVYYKLVAGMIGETVKIANKIKNCKLTTTKEEIGVWDNSLKSFEILGMKVGFLRDRIHTLLEYVLESEDRFDLQRYNEAENEKKQIENEIKDVMKKLEGLKESCGKLDFIVGGLKEKFGRHEAKFQEVVNAPW